MKGLAKGSADGNCLLQVVWEDRAWESGWKGPRGERGEHRDVLEVTPSRAVLRGGRWGPCLDPGPAQAGEALLQPEN